MWKGEDSIDLFSETRPVSFPGPSEVIGCDFNASGVSGNECHMTLPVSPSSQGCGVIPLGHHWKWRHSIAMRQSSHLKVNCEEWGNCGEQLIWGMFWINGFFNAYVSWYWAAKTRHSTLKRMSCVYRSSPSFKGMLSTELRNGSHSGFDRTMLLMLGCVSDSLIVWISLFDLLI